VRGPRPGHPRGRWRHGVRGVALLEMLVALTVLATAGAILFGWVFQSSVQLQRLNNQQLLALAQLQALQFVGGVNPAITPQGRQAFVGFVLNWEASARTPMRQVLDGRDGPLPSQIAIFDVRLTLRREGEANPWHEFKTQLPGWRSDAGGGGPPSLIGISGVTAK